MLDAAPSPRSPPSALISYTICTTQRSAAAQFATSFQGWCPQLPHQATLVEEGDLIWHFFSKKSMGPKKRGKKTNNLHNHNQHFVTILHNAHWIATAALLSISPAHASHPQGITTAKIQLQREEREGQREGQGENVSTRKTAGFRKKSLLCLHKEQELLLRQIGGEAWRKTKPPRPSFSALARCLDGCLCARKALPSSVFVSKEMEHPGPPWGHLPI